MKKLLFCGVFTVALLLVFASCGNWEKTEELECGDKAESAEIDDFGERLCLITDDMAEMTVVYINYGKESSYRADEKVIKQFSDFVNDIPLIALSETDRMSFSGLDGKAEFKSEFSAVFPDKTLDFYSEGCIRVGADCYFISLDSFYLIRKIIVPDLSGVKERALDFETPPVPSDINPELADEIPLYIPPRRDVYPHGGGIIAFNSVTAEQSGGKPYVRACKYGENGEFLWAQTYGDFETTNFGAVNLFTETSDGGFVFYLSGSKEVPLNPATARPEQIAAGELDYEHNQWLIKCDKDGGLIHREELLPDYKGTWNWALVQSIFETPNGEIITVGNEELLDWSEYLTVDVILMKFDKNGKFLDKKIVADNNDSSIGRASYDPEIGLVVPDGKFAAVVVYDDNLNEKWRYVFEDDIYKYGGYSAVMGGNIYVAGSRNESESPLQPERAETVVYKFSPSGELLKSQSFDAIFLNSLTAVNDSYLLISTSYYTGEGSPENTEQIIKADEELQVTQTIDSINNGGTITPTQDGGFFTVGLVKVNYLPQNPFMSFTLANRATVLTRYDEAGTIIFRKVYDKNHFVPNADFVLPLYNGRLVIDN